MLVHDLGPNGRDIVAIVDPPRNGKVLVRFPSGALLTVQEHHLTATPTTRRTHRTHDLPTAIDAARATTPTLGHTQWQVLDALAHAAEQGLIDAEHEAINGLRPDSAGKRRKELEELGLVTDTGRQRDTPRGRRAQVWAITPAGLDIWHHEHRNRRTA
jgi:DNA-binding MarR family transcriptional regulator